jgi:hypothetical protein
MSIVNNVHCPQSALASYRNSCCNRHDPFDIHCSGNAISTTKYVERGLSVTTRVMIWYFYLVLLMYVFQIAISKKLNA